MKSAVPAWLGWPGDPRPPGSDWISGPLLRMVVLGLACAFLALALTVNYVASVSFFLLAILGMYVGFHRGFVAGLTRVERLAMIAFVAYLAVAILSYMVGTQTNVGYRFLGRDLRFLLFIPVYLAIRWSRPRIRLFGWALAGGTVGAFIMALLQSQPWPAPTPHGVAGTHISFGDLVILSGFLAAALLAPVGSGKPTNRFWYRVAWSGSLVSVLAGLGTGVVAHARGGWLCVPILLMLIILWPLRRDKIGISWRLIAAAIAVVVMGSCIWFIPKLHHAVYHAESDFSNYLLTANSRHFHTPCVAEKGFLNALRGRSRSEGKGRVAVRKLPLAQQSETAALGCHGKYALLLTAASDQNHPFEFYLYRGNRFPAESPRQSATILAKGQGSFNVGWRGQWVEIGGEDAWRRYDVMGVYRQTVPAYIHVPPGGQLWVIPIQKPHGIYAYALSASSLGQRLEMWRAAVALFVANPWLGMGTGSFLGTAKTALGNAPATRLMGHYEHAHNDYLTSLATRGIFGLLSYLAILILPLWALTSRPEGSDRKLLALAGAFLTVAFVIFGLTETMFSHSLVISWYALMASVLLALRYGADESGAMTETSGRPLPDARRIRAVNENERLDSR